MAWLRQFAWDMIHLTEGEKFLKYWKLELLAAALFAIVWFAIVLPRWRDK